ncbi:hypothetical protein K491DRAFT_684341 [Lophiostoma macrostomum CBS 122681]|uniref:Uncharacterized protein n=1 Tax=Lophiostoma macrostomum CBS 122681 TaxID=1314788 RepID=A0A6A6SQH1_9PLEO|nr:hypothetical protein K491DRAFT_684341 [Lophiostoma macrostomum CBS 122681]
MFFEVWWLAVSFSLGCMRLFAIWMLHDSGTTTWGFGQVMPVVLLAAPLVTISEAFFLVKTTKANDETTSTGSSDSNDSAAEQPSGEPSASGSCTSNQSTANPSSSNGTILSSAIQHPSSPITSTKTPLTPSTATPVGDLTSASPPARVQTMQLAASASRMALDGLNDHPEHDYYGQSPYVRHGITLSIGASETGRSMLAFQGLLGPAAGLPKFLTWTPFSIPLSFVHYLLWSFMIEGFRQQGTGVPWIRIPLAHNLNFCLVFVTVLMYYSSLSAGSLILFLYSASYWIVSISKVCWEKARRALAQTA